MKVVLCIAGASAVAAFFFMAFLLGILTQQGPLETLQEKPKPVNKFTEGLTEEQLEQGLRNIKSEWGSTYLLNVTAWKEQGYDIIANKTAANEVIDIEHEKFRQQWLQQRIQAYMDRGLPRDKAELASEDGELTIYFDHSATGNFCMFTRYWGTGDRILCDDRPHIIEQRYNNTITVEFAKEYSTEGFKIIESYNNEGYEVKSTTNTPGTLWNGTPTTILYIILQKEPTETTWEAKVTVTVKTITENEEILSNQTIIRVVNQTGTGVVTTEYDECDDLKDIHVLWQFCTDYVTDALARAKEPLIYCDPEPMEGCLELYQRLLANSK